MSEKQRTFLVGAALMMLIVGGLLTFLAHSPSPLGDDPAGPAAAREAAHAELSETVATLNFRSEKITVPAPPGYCFADPKEDADRALIDVTRQMQDSYRNHLWLVFADCAGLKRVRASLDLSAYIDTGMIITPAPLLGADMPAEIFTATMKAQLDKLNPAMLENLMINATRAPAAAQPKISTGCPVIYGRTAETLLFMMVHDMSDATGLNLKMTELDAVTAIRKRPLIAIFTFRNLRQAAGKQALTKTYLDQLRAAN